MRDASFERGKRRTRRRTREARPGASTGAANTQSMRKIPGA